MTGPDGRETRLLPLFGTRHVLLIVDEAGEAREADDAGDGRSRGNSSSASELVGRVKARYGQVVEPFLVGAAVEGDPAAGQPDPGAARG